jgi:phospholipid transport system substrate-binding protein
MKTLAHLLAAALLPLSLLSGAAAAETAPDALLTRISNEVLEDLRRNPKDPARAAALIETKLLPHFDAHRATRMAVGAYWRQATPDQQQRLVQEFTALLVRTYSNALAGYSGQRLEFAPLRARPGDDEVTVRSLVRQSGAEPVAIEYDLDRSSGAWKVFDVRVAGISLVATYRSAFAEHARNHGIEGLLELLQSRNRKLQSALRL